MVEHDLALSREVLRLGELVDEPAGEHVDELDRRVADENRRAVPTATAIFIASCTSAAPA